MRERYRPSGEPSRIRPWRGRALSSAMQPKTSSSRLKQSRPQSPSRRIVMSRIVRCGLIQASNQEAAESPLAKIKQAMIDKHVSMIEDAAKKGVQIICLQELFYGPYFPAEQNPHWYDLVERIPDGPTTQLMCEIARRHKMVMVVPIYEEEM